MESNDKQQSNPGTPRAKILFFVFAGTVSVLLLVVGLFQLVDFTDTKAFCGELCHSPMYPEYTVNQASVHSNVSCAECHVGPGFENLVKSKVRAVPELISVVRNSFERPLAEPSENLLPGNVMCGQCHNPTKSYGDVTLTDVTYLTDEANTRQTSSVILKIGDGSPTNAQGIHKHMVSQISYLPLDSTRQTITWVGAKGKDGTLTEYTNPQTSKAAMSNKQNNENARVMDCIDCHNRPTHDFQSPEQLIDTAISTGKIDKSLPFIKREGARALYPVNSSLEEANNKISTIADFYRISYPQVYATKKQAIDNAITQLKEVAHLTTFPDMKVSWQTYPNNIGHQESNGCFRCHGKLIATTGSNKGKVLDVSCNLCHYPVAQQ